MTEKQIVIIDPVKETIYKTFDSKKSAGEYLGINIKFLYTRLNGTYNSRNAEYPYCCIIKYLDDATPENIKKWSENCNYGLNNERRCPKCKEWKDKSEFIESNCRPCKKKRQRAYISTEKGFFIKLACAIKSNSKRRNAKGRLDAGVCTINSDFLIKLFNEQNGLCYYSGLPMNKQQLSNWQVSCERLDNNLGYIPSNVKLVCLEFNTGNGQWSKEKVVQINKLINKKVNLVKLKKQIEEAKQARKPGPIKVRKEPIIKDGIELIHCTKCDKHLEKNCFTMDRKALSAYCCNCKKIKLRDYHQTMRGFLMKICQHAEKHALKISKNKKRSAENSEFNLTLDNILQKIIDQKGRCAYSNIPLTFTLDSPWRLSIERTNNKKGYTIDNIVLICIEFNTGDNSWKSDDATGSCQWSKEKVDHFLKNMKI